MTHRPTTRLITFIIAFTGAIGLFAATACAAAAGGEVTDCTTQQDFVAKLSGGGIVTFNCEGWEAPATIVLTATQTITRPTEIHGGGVITISAGHARRLFQVEAGTSLSVRYLTLADANVGGEWENVGGAVYVAGGFDANKAVFVGNVAGRGGALFAVAGSQVSIVNSIFSDNTHTIYNDHGTVTVTASTLLNNFGILENGGSMIVQDSLFQDNGGALQNYGGGMLTISNTVLRGSLYGAIDVVGGQVVLTRTSIIGTVASNAQSGGIDNMSYLTMFDSAILDNFSYNSAGAIHNEPWGHATLIRTTIAGNTGMVGGIYNEGEMSILNSTLVRNSGIDGGAIVNVTSGSADLNHVTIVSNTSSAVAGINSPLSVVTIRASLLAANSPGGNCGNGTNVVSSGWNLSSDRSCALSQVTDLTGTSPLLGDFGYHRGANQTVALLPGSPALDRYVTDCPDTDQRQVSRPRGVGCDIGAYELITPVAQLSVGAAGPSSVQAGSAVTYTLMVTNQGPGPANTILITSTLPSGSLYISGGTRSGNIVSWRTDVLLAFGAPLQVTLVVTAIPTLRFGDYRVSADNADEATGPLIVTMTNSRQLRLPVVRRK